MVYKTPFASVLVNVFVSVVGAVNESVDEGMFDDDGATDTEDSAAAADDSTALDCAADLIVSYVDQHAC